MSDLPEPTSPTFDLIQRHNSHPRRARPPDLCDGADDALRVPLRPETGDKGRKRESRLGLRNIFGRGRGGSDADKAPAAPPARAVPQRPSGIRASLAEINWPYSLHHAQGHRSEITLPSSTKALPPGQSLKHKKSESVVRQQQQGQQQQPNPEGLAAWNPPPLFQAYPQAVKHAHLPACTVPADVVLRLHHHKSSSPLAGLLSPNHLDIPEETSGEKPRRRHRRNGSGSASRFEWTSKVFVLATSGWLLQYAGEGSFDRLPEKVLRLGKESAAFASDAIPGRHWVLQVSAVAEPDRTGSHGSLRARLPFRGQERRHSSTFLMVFESADQMDSWIAILRREIENLGGRKVLSETGKPKAGGHEAQLRNQSSQRTLVVRDPDRFSRVMSPDPPLSPTLPISSPDGTSLDPTHEDLAARDLSFDDNSTASFISHEGRQLDALRDSTNRLSYMSSGQRTMVTSVGSSPACSPIRDSFCEFDTMPELPHPDDHPQPRMRPNAMAIIDRRQSLQTINHVFDMRVASARPSSNFMGTGQPDAAMSFPPAQQTMPNFSAPYSANKRHSFARTPLGMLPAHGTTSSPLVARMSTRRPPPSALSINPRPLSLVEDQPSPALSSLSRTGTTTGGTGSPLSTIPMTPPISAPSPARLESEMAELKVQNESIRDSGISTEESSPEPMLPIQRPQSEVIDADTLGHIASPSRRVPPPAPYTISRSVSSMGRYGGDGAHPSAKPGMRMRRLSFGSPEQGGEKRHSGLFSPPPTIRPDYATRPVTPSLRPVARSAQQLRESEPQTTSLQRRSMSHTHPTTTTSTEGPPPAPPPNRALPPIPQRAKFNVVPPPGFI
ncbi:hypothetical protein C8A05DRAFT_32165 [Staphylotrichum tortipilum]|uniref:PH domain-containing protein n=1 Tax=Staphylotrichum tortipilum TaxID=2831512 RepID=A0AAN6MNB5_9PEZI|nr:hypothetical protein C8A05DRAFT_32165 [Staphylotrichum longicolle]